MGQNNNTEVKISVNTSDKNSSKPKPKPKSEGTKQMGGRYIKALKGMNQTNITSTNMLNKQSKQNQSTAIKPSKPASKKNQTSSKANDDVLIEVKALKTKSEHQNIGILSTDITTLYINNEFAVDSNPHTNLKGSQSFRIKYPKLPGSQYKTNEIRKFCFYFTLKVNTFGINAAQIDIIFNEFKLESGFDKILIRHFNDSFVDPPISLVGKAYNLNSTKYPNAYSKLLESMNQKYYLYPSESKAICIEFQSDDSIVEKGFDISVNIKYDTCQWTDWEECKTMNLVGIKWSRGPMSNGKCGVGVTKRQRLLTPNSSEVVSDGYIDCSTDFATHSTEFCIKAPCSNYDLSADKDFPPKPMPGWAWYNFRYLVGIYVCLCVIVFHYITRYTVDIIMVSVDMILSILIHFDCICLKTITRHLVIYPNEWMNY